VIYKTYVGKRVLYGTPLCLSVDSNNINRRRMLTKVEGSQDRALERACKALEQEFDGVRVSNYPDWFQVP
jgi:hypothetical protein